MPRKEKKWRNKAIVDLYNKDKDKSQKQGWTFTKIGNLFDLSRQRTRNLYHQYKDKYSENSD